VRPEKVHLLAPGEAGPGGAHVEDGVISDVVYLGVVTRYVVTLDGGGDLVAVRQNLETAAVDALQSRGQRTRVAWRDDQAYEIPKRSASEEER
jgi:putative spermidine/putrescine transport system ATP-binding protein